MGAALAARPVLSTVKVIEPEPWQDIGWPFFEAVFMGKSSINDDQWEIFPIARLDV
jgi:hypothetical protein